MILETRHLQLMAAVAEHGTLTGARKDLHLTQSAISHQLITLEGRLGTQLFHRLGRRMAPTSAGHRLLEAARRTLGELRAAEDDLRRTAAGRSGVLRVSTECYTVYHWMPRIMRDFAARFPSIEVKIVVEATNDPIAALHEGRIDVAVMTACHAGPHLRAIPLFEDELRLVTAPGHPLARRRSVALADLATEHLVSYAPLNEPGSLLGRLLDEAGVTPRRTSTIQLTEAILELVQAGEGVAVLAQWAVAPRVAAGQLSAVRLTPAGITRCWYAVALRETAVLKQVRAFAALLTHGPLEEDPAPAPVTPQRAPRSAPGRTRRRSSRS